MERIKKNIVETGVRNVVSRLLTVADQENEQDGI